MNKNKLKIIVADILIGVLALFILAIFIWGTIVPFIQMCAFNYYASQKDITPLLHSSLVNNIYTNVDKDIANAYVENIKNANINDPSYSEFLDKTIETLENLVQRSPYYSQYYVVLAQAYDRKGSFLNDDNYFRKSSSYYKKALDLFPRRQEVKYAYALNLIANKNIDEGMALLMNTYQENPDIPASSYYLGVALAYMGGDNYIKSLDYLESALDKGVNINPNSTNTAYQDFIIYFYKQRDMTRFISAAKRLSEIDPSRKDVLLQVVNFIEKNKTFPVLNFN